MIQGNFSAWQRFGTLAALSGVLLCPQLAGADDGAVEISQAGALAGNVTPGDAPNFPVTISRAGSYVLTSSLVTQAGQAIRVTAQDVKIDLNGFTVSCNVGGGGCGLDDGIEADLQRVSVRNGTVQDFGGDGIDLNTHSVVEDVIARTNGSVGIRVGNNSHVDGCSSSDNTQAGIVAGGSSVITENIASGNGTTGISATNSTFTGNVANGNTGTGITGNGTFRGNSASSNNIGLSATGNSVAVNNQLVSNTSVGLSGPTISFGCIGALAYGANVISNNNGAVLATATDPQVGGSCNVQISANVCHRDLVCP